MFQRFIALAVLFQSSRFHRFAVSKFQSFTASLFQSFKVSLLRCFRVSSHLRCCFKVSGFTASLFQSFIASLFQSSRFHRFAVSKFHRTCGAVSKFQVSPLRCFRVSSHLRCCFKVPGFTTSLFQSFITPPPSGTQNKPRLRLFAFKSGPPEQTKTSSVCYGEKRRYMSPNDAGHQSLRPCYRTRRVL